MASGALHAIEHRDRMHRVGAGIGLPRPSGKATWVAARDIRVAQLRQLWDGPLTAAELEQAKRAAAGGFALTLEQPQQLLTNSYLRFRYGFSADYWERFPAKINAVTSGEIQAVAQK